MNKVDITDKVDFGINDDEFLPIKKCICGEKFIFWDFFISMNEYYPRECPKCRRKFFFTIETKVYEVKDE